MYNALYNFETKDPSALNFHDKEKFTVVNTKDPHWWLVQNGTGVVGYVPANYLGKDTSSDNSDALHHIDQAILAITTLCSRGQQSAQQLANLQKLKKHRQEFLQDKPELQTQRSSISIQRSVSRKGSAPPPPSNTAVTKASQVTSRQDVPHRKKGQAPAVPSPRQSSLSTDNSSCPSSEASDDSPRMAEHNISSKPAALLQQYSFTSQVSHQEPVSVRHSRERSQSPLSSSLSEKNWKERRDSNNYRGSPHRSVSVGQVPFSLCADLVDAVRSRTGLSYDMSQMAVATVISQLRDKIPGIKEPMETLLSNLHTNDTDQTGDLTAREDGVALRRHFKELAQCKDDSQQRSWFLHEDEAIIQKNIQGLLEILDNANPELSKMIVAEDNYEAVHNLILYYQMEARVSIRLILLQVFGALCGLEKKLVSEILYSVLPLELARDMQADTLDLQKLMYSGLVLAMVFSTGEPLPVHHDEHLNCEFVAFLLGLIEDPLEEDVEDRVPDLALQVMLAFNLHFQHPDDNMVMQVLSRKCTANTFMEKIMLLVNREVDPVHILPHEGAPPNSLLKLMSDLYSSPDTANLLYTNDAKVLVDIILRHLRDLCPGDKMRTEYLSLFQLLLKNSNYGDYQHRQNQLQECFIRISLEEEQEVGADTDMDKQIVQLIWTEFPQFFQQPS